MFIARIIIFIKLKKDVNYKKGSPKAIIKWMFTFFLGIWTGYWFPKKLQTFQEL